MKKTIFFLAAILICITSFGQGQTYVHSYYRSNGTYVEGYYRTLPNNTKNDNWSTIGNINPYTGVKGTKPRDATTESNTPIYYNPSPSYYSNSPDYYIQDNYTSTRKSKRIKTYKCLGVVVLQAALIGFIVHSLSHTSISLSPSI